MSQNTHICAKFGAFMKVLYQSAQLVSLATPLCYCPGLTVQSFASHNMYCAQYCDAIYWIIVRVVHCQTKAATEVDTGILADTCSRGYQRAGCTKGPVLPQTQLASNLSLQVLISMQQMHVAALPSLLALNISDASTDHSNYVLQA